MKNSNRWLYLNEDSLNFSDSMKHIELAWKTKFGSLEWTFLLPNFILLYIVLLLPVTVNKLCNNLHIVNNYINVCLLLTVKNCLKLILLSQGVFS